MSGHNHLKHMQMHGFCPYCDPVKFVVGFDPSTLPRYNLTKSELAQIEEWSRSASLADLSRVIIRTWPRVRSSARPYLAAMAEHTESARACYGHESGRGVVLHFLSESRGKYRGPVADIILAELSRRCV